MVYNFKYINIEKRNYNIILKKLNMIDIKFPFSNCINYAQHLKG